MNSASNTVICPTTAYIRRHEFRNFVVRRVRSLREQRRGRHNLSALAVSALRNILRNPGLLQRMQPVRAQTFDCRDVLAGGFRNAHRASPRERTVYVHAARAAQANAAAEFRARQLKRVAQIPEQRGVWGNINVLLSAIYAESDIRHG